MPYFHKKVFNFEIQKCGQILDPFSHARSHLMSEVIIACMFDLQAIAADVLFKLL